MFLLVTFAPYNYAWFQTFEEAFDTWANMTHPSPDARVEIQHGDFYWTVQLTASTHRPTDQLPA